MTKDGIRIVHNWISEGIGNMDRKSDTIRTKGKIQKKNSSLVH
jgi:hypothetical protein